VGKWDVRAPRVPRLVWPVPVDPTGTTGPTYGARVGPCWRRTSAGLFVPAEVGDDLVEQRILEQAVRLTTGAVTGWAALRLHGAGYFDGRARDGVTRLPVLLAANQDRIRGNAASVVVRAVVPEHEIVVRHGIRCTTVERALFDEMSRAGCEDDAVVAADMACAAELTSLRRMRAYVARRAGQRGIEQVVTALGQADEGSRSPMETRFRQVWRRAGWPRPLCNRGVLDGRGRLIGVPDLLDQRRGIAGEFDGADHRAIGRHRRDVRREDLFRRVGLEYFAVVGADLDDEQLVHERMEATRARAGLLPRAWHLAPPGPSLDERLDQRDFMRELAEGGDLPNLE
jgi:hypothetical protein